MPVAKIQKSVISKTPSLRLRLRISRLRLGRISFGLCSPCVRVLFGFCSVIVRY
jgi:hypothetical protein